MLNRHFSACNNCLISVTAAAATALLLAGCKDKDEIKVYRISKAPMEEPAQPSAATAAPDISGAGPATDGGVGAGEAVPDQTGGRPGPGWEPQPLSAMRQASYLVRGAGGATADISLVMLEGQAGGMLENVNRWLGQLGQPAIDEDKLSRIAQHVNAPLGDVTVVDLQGLQPGGDPLKDGRTIGGIASTGGRTIFFKMHGNAELTESNKQAFLEWIGSIQPASAQPASAPVADLSRAAAPSEKPPIGWTVPDGWASVPATAMRVASFAVTAQDGARGDVSVSALEGEAGGDLMNVNRWRGQVGLGPVDDGQLKSIVTPLKTQDGDARMVDLAGGGTAMLAAWAHVDGRSWFFKLTGSPALVQAEKDKFTAFVQSVKFHP